MGPTKVFKTQFEAPDSIRGQFGLSDTRNATHGSGGHFQLCFFFDALFQILQSPFAKKSACFSHTLT